MLSQVLFILNILLSDYPCFINQLIKSFEDAPAHFKCKLFTIQANLLDQVSEDHGLTHANELLDSLRIQNHLRHGV
jgi:hypothetical protein